VGSSWTDGSVGGAGGWRAPAAARRAVVLWLLRCFVVPASIVKSIGIVSGARRRAKEVLVVPAGAVTSCHTPLVLQQ